MRASLLLLVPAAACSLGPPEVHVPPPEIRTVYSFTMPSGTTRHVETTRSTFDRPRPVPLDGQAVLEALPGIYAGLGIPDAVLLNEEESLFGRRQLQVRFALGETRLSRIVRCGSLFGSGEGVNPVTMTVMTVVEEEAGATRVRSWVDATARDVSGTGSAPVQCGSTGWLERQIVAALSDRS